MKRLLFLPLLLSAFACAKDNAISYRDYLDAAARVDHFSGTVLVALEGKVVFEQAYGLADRKSQTPNTIETMYRIGSMSKPITATAVMSLRDSGKLKISDSICRYLSPCPAAWKAITHR
jgi:CubicO group peptidase (beta-lactamase class C family)